MFQVIRIVPYSAVQLFAYETYKVYNLSISDSGFILKVLFFSLKKSNHCLLLSARFAFFDVLETL